MKDKPLTKLQSDVLYWAFNPKKGVPLTEVAQMVERPRSRVLKVVDSLILKKLMQCDEDGWLLYLTEAGRKLRSGPQR